ncbi:hypothetical protein M3J09_005152 [Ascochyta lentis]
MRDLKWRKFNWLWQFDSSLIEWERKMCLSISSTLLGSAHLCSLVPLRAPAVEVSTAAERGLLAGAGLSVRALLCLISLPLFSGLVSSSFVLVKLFNLQAHLSLLQQRLSISRSPLSMRLSTHPVDQEDKDQTRR